MSMIREKTVKREAEESKKQEKVLKKDMNEFEEISGPGANVKQVHDKIVKTLNNMRKITKEAGRFKADTQEFKCKTNEYTDKITSSIKKQKMLSMICTQFMK